MRFPNGEDSEAPWDEAKFREERAWYSKLYGFNSGNKQDYQEDRQRAESDPNYDLFDHWMPTGQPKRDIGMYALQQGIRVPLIRSMQEWQRAFIEGNAMLRSEMRQDYAGLSGLLSSTSFPLQFSGPAPAAIDKSEVNEADHLDWIDGEFVYSRRAVGPMNAQVHLELGGDDFKDIGTPSVVEEVESLMRKGLYNGTVDPSRFMHTFRWGQDSMKVLATGGIQLFNDGLRYDLRNAKASRWRFIPGVNLKVFRDPGVPERYHIGGDGKYAYWRVEDGDYEDVTMDDPHDRFMYTLPTAKIIKLYERVRTLPYFDQRQTPVIEMQYGDDGRLYFLQYLKTGLTLNEAGRFALPQDLGAITISHVVRGHTGPEGEKVRLYIEPSRITERMKGQAVRAEFDHFHESQTMAMAAKIVLANSLSFQHGHYADAPLTRPLVSFGLQQSRQARDENAALMRRLHNIEPPFRTVLDPQPTENIYIDAIITSNGHEATIQSDWAPKTDPIY